MAKTTAEKLRIREEDVLLTINEPPSFRMGLGKLPAGVRLTRKSASCNQVHWFVANRDDMEKKLARVMDLLKPGVLVWVYYPKGSSGLQADLTRDKGWDALMAHGDRDFPHLMTQAEEMERVLRACAVPVRRLVLRNADHFIASYLAGEAGSAFVDAALQFMGSGRP